VDIEKIQHPGGRRTEDRIVVDRFESVQMSIRGVPALYHFRVWNLSSRGLCIVVQQRSSLLRHLRCGQELQMGYFSAGGSRVIRELTTRISHITPQEEGRFRGHCLVGLLILEDSRRSGEKSLAVDGKPGETRPSQWEGEESET